MIRALMIALCLASLSLTGCNMFQGLAEDIDDTAKAGEAAIDNAGKE